MCADVHISAHHKEKSKMPRAGSIILLIVFTSILIIVALATLSCASHSVDAISSATTGLSVPTESEPAAETEVLLVLAASSSGSTAKVARAIADELDAMVVGPDRGDVLKSSDFMLVGFGSGIFHGKHHTALLALADDLPPARHRKAFIFSTCGIPARFASPKLLADYVNKNHEALREKLCAKGYQIVGEFGCPGFNDNKFLKLFGGFNRGRPDAGDLERARSFAKELMLHLSIP
jgi:flavodoxin